MVFDSHWLKVGVNKPTSFPVGRQTEMLEDKKSEGWWCGASSWEGHHCIFGGIANWLDVCLGKDANVLMERKKCLLEVLIKGKIRYGHRVRAPQTISPAGGDLGNVLRTSVSTRRWRKHPSSQDRLDEWPKSKEQRFSTHDKGG